LVFVSYDAATDYWITLHLVTELAFGRFHDLYLCDAEALLRRRQRDSGLSVLHPTDAFWVLLLHCMLDKGRIVERHRAGLERLGAECERGSLIERMVSQVAPTEGRAADFLERVQSARWTVLEEMAPALKSEWRRRRSLSAGSHAVLHVSRQIRGKILIPARRRGVRVALLGPDGAGKSTLAASLRTSLYFPVRTIYMGLADDRVPRFARLRVPGMGAPGRFLITLWRFLVGEYSSARGHSVLFDRYTYDVLLPSKHQHNRVKQRFRWILAHLFPAPDLALLLDAPGEALFARKGEYDPRHMEAHRQHLLDLRDQVPNFAVIDATQPKEVVRVQAMDKIWRRYCECWAMR
jgi:thymidylate kinase